MTRRLFTDAEWQAVMGAVSRAEDDWQAEGEDPAKIRALIRAARKLHAMQARTEDRRAGQRVHRATEEEQ